MFSSGKIKRSSKHISRQIISLVLVLAMMLSLPVPVELFAAESPSTSAVGDGAAKDENIYAVLYRKDGSNSSNYLNLELVFQNSDAPIAGRRCRCNISQLCRNTVSQQGYLSQQRSSRSLKLKT